MKKNSSKLVLIIVLAMLLFSIFSIMGNIFAGIIAYGIINIIYVVVAVKVKQEKENNKWIVLAIVVRKGEEDSGNRVLFDFLSRILTGQVKIIEISRKLCYDNFVWLGMKNQKKGETKDYERI